MSSDHAPDLHEENQDLKQENLVLKERERTFLDSIEKYKVIIENMMDNITIIDLEGTTIYENPSIEGMLGYKPEEMVGRNVFEFIHEDDIPLVEEVFGQVVMSSGDKHSVEYRFRHKDGSWRYLQSVGKKHVPENDDPVLIVSTRDISEKRETEERIRKQDEIYKIILQNFPNGTVTLYDRDLRYILAEGQELRRVNVTPEMLTGKTIYELMPKDKADFLAQYMLPSFDGNEYSYEIQNGPRCYRLTTLPIVEDNNEIHRCLALTQNITDMKNAMDELERTTKDLVETRQELINSEKNMVLGKFSSYIAHEIRNPLANIRASAQFLLKKTKEDPALAVYIDVILRNSETANEKLKEMLDFSSPRAIELEKGDITDVINNVIRLTSMRAEDNNVEVRLNKISGEFPNIMINEKKMQEAVLNFFVNSIDAMPAGGTLTVNLDKDAEDLYLSIQDTGHGIPNELIDKILEPFFTTKTGGTGLGMSIAARTIYSHKGTMKIESKEGEGTRIMITLPLH